MHLVHCSCSFPVQTVTEQRWLVQRGVCALCYLKIFLSSLCTVLHVAMKAGRWPQPVSSRSLNQIWSSGWFFLFGNFSGAFLPSELCVVNKLAEIIERGEGFWHPGRGRTVNLQTHIAHNFSPGYLTLRWLSGSFPLLCSPLGHRITAEGHHAEQPVTPVTALCFSELLPHDIQNPFQVLIYVRSNQYQCPVFKF